MEQDFADDMTTGYRADDVDLLSGRARHRTVLISRILLIVIVVGTLATIIGLIAT